MTDREYDEFGRMVFGDFKNGEAREAGKTVLSKGSIDLSLLDEAVEGLCTKLLHTMPDCLTKTVESVRKHKLEHWDRNRETNRAWLALNMMTEANAGFRAFHYGARKNREVDFVRLRQRLAEGARRSEELIAEIAPWAAPENAKGKNRATLTVPVHSSRAGSAHHLGVAEGEHTGSFHDPRTLDSALFFLCAPGAS